MSRRADPARIETARRSATIARLISAGEPADRAAAWVARWEATVGGPPDRAAWEAFEGWLSQERRVRGSSDAPPGPDQAGGPGRHEV